MSAPVFAPVDRLAVLGLGLLGGSAALAARERGLARHVVGAARRRAPLEAALERGVVDEVASPGEAVREADLVLLATPVGAMLETLRGVSEALAPGTLVTDVGSVKAPLVETLPGVLPPGVHYVGAHPMAGSHQQGVEHARGDLFEGAACVLTPGASTDSGPLERARWFWAGLGARVVDRSPLGHDEQVAWVSHVPHLLAFAYAQALEAAPERTGELAGSGFRDFTRIAASAPELWGDILAANHKAVAGPIHEVSRRLARLAQALEASDAEAMAEIFQAARTQLAEREAESNAPQGATYFARSGGENPEIPAARASSPERSSRERS